MPQLLRAESSPFFGWDPRPGGGRSGTPVREILLILLSIYHKAFLYADINHEIRAQFRDLVSHLIVYSTTKLFILPESIRGKYNIITFHGEEERKSGKRNTPGGMCINQKEMNSNALPEEKFIHGQMVKIVNPSGFHFFRRSRKKNPGENAPSLRSFDGKWRGKFANRLDGGRW